MWSLNLDITGNTHGKVSAYILNTLRLSFYVKTNSCQVADADIHFRLKQPLSNFLLYTDKMTIIGRLRMALDIWMQK